MSSTPLTKWVPRRGPTYTDHSVAHTLVPNRVPPPADLRDRAATADRAGHIVHVLLFVLFGLTLPLGMIPWAKEIAFGGLIVWSVLRATIGHVPWAWNGIAQSPIVWLLGLWLLWSASSIAWSPAPYWGLDQLKALRFLCVPLLVWPVVSRWRLAFAAFTIGGTVVAIIVLMQGLEWISAEGRIERPAAYMGLVAPVLAITAAGHIAFALVQPGRWSVAWHLLGGSLSILALVFNATRSSWIAIVVAALIVVITLVLLTPELRTRTLLVVTALVTGLAIAITIDAALIDSTGADRINSRLQQALEGLSAPEHDHPLAAVNQGATSYRLKMWHGTRGAILARPITGWGLGGLSDGLAGRPGLVYREHESMDSAQFNPHSSFLYQAASTGLIGFALFSCVLVCGLWMLTLRVATMPTMAVPLCMLTAWIVPSVFETTLLSGVGVGLLAFLLTPTLMLKQSGPIE